MRERSDALAVTSGTTNGIDLTTGVAVQGRTSFPAPFRNEEMLQVTPVITKTCTGSDSNGGNWRKGQGVTDVTVETCGQSVHNSNLADVRKDKRNDQYHHRLKGLSN